MRAIQYSLANHFSSHYEHLMLSLTDFSIVSLHLHPVIKIKEGSKRRESLLNLLYLVAKRGDKLSIVFFIVCMNFDLERQIYTK